ncbi:NAD(P)H-dependent oxidoreductase [Phyllobacterium sp. OV277]|jgi:NAD(P)H dehydrogenase (quinone)|uniref:NAD(P)H-dependent oxidoreductase n=1 Tax=Phyllobacterium sp. OV277 TaxID=1882772 RepID=UPI0008844993|nr:NAD(P)H-dependent oxidoreductase [Phyllobacterium sp. OV277]SDP16563.1 NAD(P)H dehydrogenase (quinone) [Phyllobacterium sp. OV277]
MHALIVVAHPEPTSLSHSIAAQVAEGVSLSSHTFEIADLSAEAFDPRYSAADLAVHRTQATPPADIVAEQARIDRADTLVLVFPVYWWSMPGLLKGWIDRVFSNGWAFDFSPDTGSVKKLHHLKVHLIGIGGADEEMYTRHNYLTAMKTQIDHGIFDYCGARVVTSEILFDSEIRDTAPFLAKARDIGRDLFNAGGQGEANKAA